MKTLRILLAAVLLSSVLSMTSGYARTKTVTSEYIYHFPENISPERAKEEALNRARAQAIANEFGTVVTQSTSVMIDNSDGETKSDFLALGGSDLKGEWLEDVVAPKFEYITDGGSIALKVTVKGKIREIEGTSVPVAVNILKNGITSAHESDQFVSGDDLYMSLNSPVSGYAVIYLMDAGDNVFCLLPYQSQSEGFFEIKANKKYLFFNPKYPGELAKDDIDGIIVETESQREVNRIFIVFSPNKFYKGADAELDKESPRYMTKSVFSKWLSDTRKKDKDLTIIERAITIFANK